MVIQCVVTLAMIETRMETAKYSRKHLLLCGTSEIGFRNV